jgi:hypothetical protein
MDLLKKAPKDDKLGKVLKGEIHLQLNFPHPSIVLQNVVDLPIFSFRLGKNKERNLNGLSPVQPMGVPKGSFFTIPNLIVMLPPTHNTLR